MNRFINCLNVLLFLNFVFFLFRFLINVSGLFCCVIGILNKWLFSIYYLLYLLENGVMFFVLSFLEVVFNFDSVLGNFLMFVFLNKFLL